MSNPFSTARKLLEVQFRDYWATLPDAVPLTWENVAFTPPEGRPWIRFAVLFGDGVQASLGSRVLEFIVGMVVVQVFAPKNSGTRTTSDLIEAVAAGLRYGQLSEEGVVVDLRAPRVTGTMDMKDHFQTNVSVEFRINHVTAVAV